MIEARKIGPRRLPTKRVTASDGSVIEKKIVQSESPTLATDLLIAFRSNVRRIRRERQERQRAAQNSS